jgi:hypothetical protein
MASSAAVAYVGLTWHPGETTLGSGWPVARWCGLASTANARDLSQTGEHLG